MIKYNDLKIKNKLLINISLIFLILTTSQVLGMTFLNKLNSNNKNMYNHNLFSIHYLDNIYGNFLNIRNLTFELLFDSNCKKNKEQTIEKINTTLSKNEILLKEFENNHLDKEIKTKYIEFKKTSQDVKNILNNTITNISNNNYDLAINSYYELIPVTQKMYKELNSIINIETDTAKKDYISNENFYKNVYAFMELIILFEFLIFILASLFLINSISERINKYLDFAKDIALGKLDSTIEVDGKDEIGILGETLNIAFNNTKNLMNKLKNSEKQLKNKIQELSRVQSLLQLDKERYDLAVDGSKDGIWDLDLINNTIYLSDRCKNLLQINKVGNTFSLDNWYNCKIITKNELSQIISNLLNENSHIYYKEFKYSSPKCKEKILLTRGKLIWDKNKFPYRMAGSLTDVTSKIKANERVKYLAYYNSLTDLPNISYLLENLPIYLKNTPKNNIGVLLSIDIDNFKGINEMYSRKFGDEALKCIANKFKDFIDKNDKLFYLNSDNFIIYCNRYDNFKNIKDYIKKLMNIFNSPLVIENTDIYLTISIGVSCYPFDSTEVDKLIKNVEIALTNSKKNGKNSYSFYKRFMETETKEKLLIQNKLIKAIENNHFQVYYQPKIKLTKNKLDSMEALVRWIDPVKGIIPSQYFIPIAEETGLIVNIGNFVLREACTQNKLWQDMGFTPLKVAVNISTKQIQQDNFVTIVKNILKDTKLDPKWLEFEVTESAIMNNFDLAINKILELKELGIKISLDDFGTGYSSLNYLRRLPIDSIKIDKSFIDNITKVDKDKFITRSLINLAHGLDLSVVAEGVETEEQLNILKKFNCDRIQGFLFSKPLNKEAFEKMIKKY